MFFTSPAIFFPTFLYSPFVGDEYYQLNADHFSQPPPLPALLNELSYLSSDVTPHYRYCSRRW